MLKSPIYYISEGKAIDYAINDFLRTFLSEIVNKLKLQSYIIQI